MSAKRTLSETVAADGPVEERTLTIGQASRLLGVDPRQVIALGADGALETTAEGRVVASSAERLVGKLPEMVARQTIVTDVELR